MDEPALRGLIDQVKCGRLSRRAFISRMIALGVLPGADQSAAEDLRFA